MAKKLKDPKVLLIGGIDPTGQAGLYRDIWVCEQLRLNYTTLPTALTAQTSKRFDNSQATTLATAQNICRAIEPSQLRAIKIGMLCNLPLTKFITKQISDLKVQNNKIKVVWDPVFKSSSNGSLLTSQAVRWSLKNLTPLVDIITPNAIEAHLILGTTLNKQNPIDTIMNLQAQLNNTVYLKGGHFKTQSLDYFYDGKKLEVLAAKKTKRKIRGTGCAQATALACGLASGLNSLKASKESKAFISKLFNFS